MNIIISTIPRKVLYVQVLRKTFPEGQGFDFLLIKCFPGCDLKIVLLSVTAEGQKLAGSESRKELFNFKVTSVPRRVPRRSTSAPHPSGERGEEVGWP